MHYQRWKKWGDVDKIGASGRPRVPKPPKKPLMTPIDRLIQRRIIVLRHFEGSRVPADSPCWESTYKVSAALGYTLVCGLYAHHVSYDEWVGERDKTLQIDHNCCNRACWNPDHLVQRTQKDNVALGMSPGARSVRSGLCSRGHAMTDAYPSSTTGYPLCRICQKARAYAKYHNVSLEEAVRHYE